MEQLDPGEIVTLSVRCRDADGNLADPTSGTLTVIAPGASTQAIDFGTWVQDGTGEFHYDYLTTIGGAYEYEFAVQGAQVSGREGGVFLVGVDSLDGPYEQWCTWQEVLDTTMVRALDQTLVEAIPDAEVESLIDTASEVMFKLSERRYPGFRTVTRSLCVQCTYCGSWLWDNWSPYSWGFRGCGCGPFDRIRLPNWYPVVAVISVTIEGQPFTAWRLDGSELVRLDGLPWPTGLDLTDPTAFQGRWVVGATVPPGGRRGAAALVANQVALDVALAACGAPSDNVTTINREGVAFTLRDPTLMLTDGFTGATIADRWLAADKAGAKLPSAGIFDPGARRVTRRTG